MLALISGATSGIGEACAKLLAKNGIDLFLIGRRSPELKNLSASLKDVGVQVFAESCDLRDREKIQAIFKTHAGIFDSHLGFLINNAGLAKGMSYFQDVNPNDHKNFDEMIDVNFKSLVFMTGQALPYLIKQKALAHIVNIGSVAGHYTYPKGNVYCATKAAVRVFNEALRQDLNGTGVRVTSIDPGMVETAFSQTRFEGDQTKAKAVYSGMTPLHAMDIAEAVLWSLNRPAHVNIQEMIIYPTDQASPALVNRREPKSLI